MPFARDARSTILRLVILAGTWAALTCHLRGSEPVVFNRDVRPILSDNCFPCHGPDANHREADLRLDVRDDATRLRDGTAAIVPGQPDPSLLVARITHAASDERMPPPESGKGLTPAEIETLRRWIEQGAEYQAHWAYLPPRHWPLPDVRDAAWGHDAVDVFLAARWEQEGLSPSVEADRITLLRRLSFDLTGLPPEPDHLTEVLADTRPDWWEREVDRLLASPQFGERLAIWWLDLVRYADTVGYHGDQEHAASPYRDYVIQAFNDNLPFDRFTREQLAGDLLADRTEEQLVASAYNRLLQTSHEGGVQVKEYLTKYSADRVRNLGGAWLGATLGCAECHNHKFDPFTQRDFYRLASFFADVDDLQSFRGGDTTPTKREPEIRVLARAERRRLAELERELAVVEQSLAEPTPTPTAPDPAAEPARKSLEQTREKLQAELQKLRASEQRVMVTAAIEPRPLRVLHRGDWMDESGEIVEPAVPASLGELAVTGRRATRLDLAEWLTSPQHPLTGRVVVNRMWSLFFGEGLCPSLDDLGSQGEWPTYPELLDVLAVDFVESGWDVKQLVRRLVTSRAYRQSSVPSEELVERDPKNLLFARQARFRLPAEMVRDNALAISGLLVQRLGGPSAHPYQPDGYYAPLNFPKRTYQADQGAQQFRRGVYMHWQRQFLHPMLRAFDAVSREECTARRPVSNTPQAALTLLNDPTFVEGARALAARVLREGGQDDAARLRWIWRVALSREPVQEELEVLRELLTSSRAHYAEQVDAAEALVSIGISPGQAGLDRVELAAWTQVARAIMNTNEVVARN